MKVAIATSTRADWGLLSPVAKLLQQMPGIELAIVAANMHLDKLRGETIDEIAADGFEIAATIDAVPTDSSKLEMALTMGQTLSLAAKQFDRIRPDILLLLGDRFEIHSVATAASALHIPIAHIAGGEITEGAIDDSFRHSISKMAVLHFATTEGHRRRLISMGEQPDKVFNVGAIGVENIMKLAPMTQEEIESSLGFSLGRRPVLVTFHPATNDTANPAERFNELLSALDLRPELSPLFTYPNNDAEGDALIDMIERFVETHQSAHSVASLGRRRYLSILKCVEAVIGNSSSGIVEVPSAGIPTVDIGIRQLRRTAAPSVIHCGNSSEEIGRAIDKALSTDFKSFATTVENPYFKQGTAAMIAEIIASSNPARLLPKRFYDAEDSLNKAKPAIL